MSQKLSNISLPLFRKFLVRVGCKVDRIRAGHEMWVSTKRQLTRPVVIQTHIDPVPEFIVKNALRTLGISREDFFKIMEEV